MTKTSLKKTIKHVECETSQCWMKTTKVAKDLVMLVLQPQKPLLYGKKGKEARATQIQTNHSFKTSSKL